MQLSVCRERERESRLFFPSYEQLNCVHCSVYRFSSARVWGCKTEYDFLNLAVAAHFVRGTVKIKKKKKKEGPGMKLSGRRNPAPPIFQ